MDFCEFSGEDAAYLNQWLYCEDELSCESTLVNLVMWQNVYNNRYAVADNALILKSRSESGEQLYSIPFGVDAQKGMSLLRLCSGRKYPVIWAQEGGRFERFQAEFSDKYTIQEIRDGFDYIYLREDIINLSGKRYHSKRNHISAFSRKYEWHYESVSENNIENVRRCAERWYEENAHRADMDLIGEKENINYVLDNMKALSVRGGAIVVEGRVVAFALGSPINDKVFDIHIEKALSDFSGAYSVINREFAANELEGFIYINREDDLGLENLRKAKLSYHPCRLVKKYLCRPTEDI